MRGRPRVQQRLERRGEAVAFSVYESYEFAPAGERPTYEQLGENQRALDYNRRAVAAYEASIGPTHPDLAIPLHNIGLVLTRQEKHTEALEHFRRALAIRKTTNSEGWGTALTRHQIGEVLALQGEHGEAVVHLKRALAIMEAQRPNDRVTKQAQAALERSEAAVRHGGA